LIAQQVSTFANTGIFYLSVLALTGNFPIKFWLPVLLCNSS